MQEMRIEKSQAEGQGTKRTENWLVDRDSMSRIQEYIVKNNIKPSDCAYHTQRTVKNSKGEPKGKIRVLARKDGTAMTEYTCPECTNSGYVEQPWKRPYYVKCEKCGQKISVPKMKDAAKKEMKKG